MNHTGKKRGIIETGSKAIMYFGIRMDYETIHLTSGSLHRRGNIKVRKTLRVLVAKLTVKN